VRSLLDPISGYRALALAERAAVPRSNGLAPVEPDDLARLRLAQWRDLTPFRSGDALARRLADEGLDEVSFERLVATPAEAIGAGLPQPPEWIAELTAAFAAEAPAAPSPLPMPDDMRSDAAVGFLELVRPWIERARARLREGIRRITQDRTPPFTPEEGERLVTETLVFRVLPLLARTLVLELHVARLQGLLSGETAEERFASFVDRLRDREAAAAILNEYPVLARLVIEELDTWVAVSLEVLERLATDWPGLVATFFAGVDPGPLTALDGGAGDRHRGGRAVRIATFASGAKLVYKPRPMAVDARFQQLLAWIETKDPSLSFHRLTVLDRGEHGWMEFAAAAGCASREELATYHRRLGGLLALLYALEATDLHYENLIAVGDHPVIVDLESLFHPRLKPGRTPRPDERLAGEALADSVIRVGLLPFRVGENEEFGGIDLSGVAVVAGQPTPEPVIQWKGIGTDEMRVVRERVTMEGGRNRPSLDGREVEAAEFMADMVAGFTDVYRLLERHRDELLAPGGWLDQFANDPVRAVLRPTRVYGLLLIESFHPDVLRDALDRDLLFDRLWVGVEDQPALARVVAFEHRDLRAGDIPAFEARPSSTDLWTSRGERVPGFFEETAMATVRRRIGALGEDDLRRQLTLLRLSLGTQLLNNDDVGWSGYAPVEPIAPLGPAKLRQRLVDSARAIGAWFEEMALRDGGYATWIGLDFRNKVWSMAALSDDLYAGLPGAALFLGYLGAITREERWTALAREAAASLLAREGTDGPALSIGAFTGWGGIVYAVAHLGALWGDRELLAAVEQMSQRIVQKVAEDEEIDVVGGAAGAVLGLLALYQAWPSQRVLDVAVRCGEHLVARSHPAGPGLGWLTKLTVDRPQIGFSHGNAGIALALVELGAAAGDARFLDAGLAGFAWEREAFWPQLHRWLEDREGPPPLESTTAIAWCYGAPGVGIARLQALRYVRSPKERRILRGEVEQAVHWTLKRGFGENHCLCHGDLGNLDFLVQARRILKDRSLDEPIELETRKVLASIERDGWLCGTRGGVESPALMNGFAGIGYGLLRLAEPQRVPSVLALAGPHFFF
jgi:class II lanthipeptide synthase